MSAETLPTVITALSAVMADVQAVRKGDRNQQQGFNFRGIDAVVNAVGPALRTHGVVAVPVNVSEHFEQYETRSGTQMRNAVLTITWRFYGPQGDHIEAQTMGEASDAGDKSVTKAHSVAYRTLLLQALCIPTDEVDPDSQTHERAARPQRQASGRNWRAEADAATDAEAVRAIYKQALEHNEMTADLAEHLTARGTALAGDPPADDQPTLPGADPWQTPVAS